MSSTISVLVATPHRVGRDPRPRARAGDGRALQSAGTCLRQAASNPPHPLRAGVRKHELAEQHRPADAKFTGLFLILVAKAPAPVWEVTTSAQGVPHLTRKSPWPYVNHYHFHVIGRKWGHLTFKLTGHPPFGVQIMLNGHEWVERRARQRAIAAVKEENCLVGGSDLRAVDRLGGALCDARAIGRVNEVCERWVYSTCLCFGLEREEQQRSGFRSQYSCFQLEYSRNLLFARGTMLEEVY